MRTTFEDLSVELFYEILSYFQPHEVFKTFSDLNSRITAIIQNYPSTSVYVGFNGMNIEVTNFYHKYLSQTNICTRLTSLCVSDTLSIGNGLWFAKHGSMFIHLRHLSLIDIIRSSFEIILDSLSPIASLILFTVRFSGSTRAVDTFIGVPEGAYHERIFRLFPSLRVCHLYFWRQIFETIDDSFVLPDDIAFMPIEATCRLLNLQSLKLRHCSPRFLIHLFEHLPQLEQFSCKLIHYLGWLPQQHPLTHIYTNQYTPVKKCLASNLRRLELDWTEEVMNIKSIEMLFECDVLSSLTNFTLFATMTGFDVLHNVLSKLSRQCLYRFSVGWCVGSEVSLSDANKILSNTFEQLKGSVPIELKSCLKEKDSFLNARTLPRMDSYLSVYSYLNSVHHGQSRWPYNKHTWNRQYLCCNKIYMSKYNEQKNEEFLSLSSNIIRWDRITSISIVQPFNRVHLHVLLLQAVNLRNLVLDYLPKYDDPISAKETSIINEKSLCDILMSNGLQQLNLTVDGIESNLIDMAHRIVERLPQLEAVQLNCGDYEVIEMIPIFINGLIKLNFIALCGSMKRGPFYDKQIRALCSSNTRPFRTEVAKNLNIDTIFIWL